MLKVIASIRLLENRRFHFSFVKSVSFSTEYDTKVSLDRAAKLKALFGVTAANSGKKPTGVLIKETTGNAEVENATVEVNDAMNNVAFNNTSEVEKNASTTDSKDSAERTWLDSGYIEYMDNQRDKGWKS